MKAQSIPCQNGRIETGRRSHINEKVYTLGHWRRVYSRQMDDGNTYYIPAIITDIKAHTYPTGILQTGDSLASNSNTAKKEGTNIVEWYTVKEAPENKSAGLNYYNTKGSLIIYRDAVLE